MTVRLAGRADIDLGAYERVAWRGAAVRIAPEALARIGASRAAFLRLIESDPDRVIYGVTTGYGQMASRRLDPEQRRAQAARPPLSAAAGFGPPLPPRVVRGIVLARLANFVEGHAAVSPALAEAVAAMLDGEPLPAVPSLGIGSAGEIIVLADLFSHLGARMVLGEKESLALVNGAPVAAALLADAALACRARLALATEVFALAAEAMLAPAQAYDAALDDLWGDPHEAATLASLRALLAGGAGARRPYQAPVSYRILPRVLGQARRALAQAEEAAGIALRAVSDNPVFVAPDDAHPFGRVLSNGGYHDARASAAIDALAGASADLALLCDRQASKLLDPAVSRLPEYLMSEEGAYIGCLAFTAADRAEQARHVASRTGLPGSEGGGFGQNDVASPVAFAWRKQGEAGECLDACLAVLAVVASQALHVDHRPAPPGALAGLLETVREDFPPLGSPRAGSGRRKRGRAVRVPDLRGIGPA